MMPTIIWTPEMSVHVSIIDEQHKKLIEIINKLNSAITGHAAIPVLDEVFTELTDYTRKHFSTEEELLQQVDYPLIVAHKEEHDGFVYKLISFRNDFENGSEVVSAKIVEFLYGWLVEHIQGSDKAYSALLNKNGIH